ncbi:hypothetical protein PROPHIGD12-2_33 [Mycobacterium phage prophiGD12-2]|nr:hypothetical protein PROPHIGD12-2_33 [Mycobacterium phage prophiGD12-2]
MRTVLANVSATVGWPTHGSKCRLAGGRHWPTLRNAKTCLYQYLYIHMHMRRIHVRGPTPQVAKRRPQNNCRLADTGRHFGTPG